MDKILHDPSLQSVLQREERLFGHEALAIDSRHNMSARQVLSIH